MYRVISTIIVIVLVGFSAIAQDISIYMMDSVYARTDVNPAFRFSNNLVFDLPGISAGAFTNGVTIGDLLIENGGLNELKLKEGMEDVNDINYVTGNMAVNIIGVGLNMGKWQLSIGYNWHYQGSINYTKDIFLLAANGNAPYIGETLDVGPELLLQSYHEVYIGASYQMSNITLGARIKLLSGINDISTDNASIKLTTEEEIYQLRVESDYVLNTTGIVDYNGIKDVDIDNDAFKGIESIIHSMTPYERSNPNVLNGSRKKRIAAGSGTNVQEINQLIKQFSEMGKMMKMMQGGGASKMMQMMKGNNLPKL